MKLELTSVAETKGGIIKGPAGVKTSLGLVSDEQGTFLMWQKITIFPKTYMTPNNFYTKCFLFCTEYLLILFKSCQKCAYLSACFFSLWLSNHCGQQGQS